LALTWRDVLKFAGWLLLSGVVGLSIVPPDYRLVTGLPHNLEHFAIFLLVGLLFGLGYPYRYLVQGVVLFLFAATVELVQVWVPGRHARISDLVASVLGLLVGLGLASISVRLARRGDGQGPPVSPLQS
jgi:VanZ family protein